MTTLPRFDPLLFNAAALQTRSARHQVLASNLANADTPAYLARDLPFATALADRLQGVPPTSRLAMAATSGRHYPGATAGAGTELLYRTALQASVDGNTVDPDVERAHFAENTVGFEFAAAMLQSTIRARQMAVTGQP